MIFNYWSFIEGLFASKKQKIFIIFAISIFLDAICDIVESIGKWTQININPTWLIGLTAVSIVFFLIFCWKYSSLKTESFKYRPIYISVLITLCLVSVLLYIIHINNNQKCVIEIPELIYEIYVLIRLIFIVHLRYCLDKQ